jgi:STE24 endopeptidase
VTRILILILFILWLAWDPSQSIAAAPFWLAVPIFFGGYLLLVIGTGVWGRFVARRVAAFNFHQLLRKFNITMDVARILISVWFAVGLYLLGWRAVVSNLLGEGLMTSVVGVIVGTLPPLLAWMGLWWSQYPADRALREQSLLGMIDADLPLHAPPTFRRYFMSNLRLQILFLGIPLLMIVLGHDVGVLIGGAFHLQGQGSDIMEIASWLISAGCVFLFAPEILRRVLHTEPLRDSALRQRLNALCQRTGIRYRDILLWKTDNNMGNAAVMGFFPRLRYILLSDLLLERMPDEEIEAVFAHELGHIVHRHMIWYVVFVVVLALINAGPGSWLAAHLTRWFGPHAQEPVLAGMMIVKFLVLFGFISRKFERQADVYAARTMQSCHPLHGRGSQDVLPGLLPDRGEVSNIGDPAPADVAFAPAPRIATISQSASPSFVGPYGATLFASALRRVAVVNNIPIASRSWCHGSIATRMQYLQGLSHDPKLTSRFDYFMSWLYAGIIGALLLSMTAFAMTTQSDALQSAGDNPPAIQPVPGMSAN